MENLISYQESRNKYLATEIKKAEDKIEEIKELDIKKDQLIKRMEVVEKLQSSRPEIVHLFDELVLTLPPGVYYNELEQKPSWVILKGYAQSKALVATLMRNLGKSEWFKDPKLKIIEKYKDKNKQGKTLFTFELTVTQATPKPETVDGKEVESK
jgi:type IV pilus assembly protein PilN